jgi:hypothetical protein
MHFTYVIWSPWFTSSILNYLLNNNHLQHLDVIIATSIFLQNLKELEIFNIMRNQ